MIIFDDRPVDVGQLSREIAALNLPGFRGVARSTRSLGANGRANLDKSGVVVRVAPRLVVKVGDIDDAQAAALNTVIADHIPPAPQTLAEQIDVARENELNKPIIAALILEVAAQSRRDPSELRSAIKNRIDIESS